MPFPTNQSKFMILKTLALLSASNPPSFRRLLSEQDLASLSATCHTARLETVDILNTKAAAKLLRSVVRGDQDKAKAMIEANPRLLLFKASAIDYSNRTIIATPFQAAIGAGDAIMWEMMIPYFQKLQADDIIESAQAEMKKQHEQQFPKTLKPLETPEFLKGYYEGLADKITQGGDVCEEALRSFRTNLTKQKKISEGHHFDINHLTAAYQAYVDKFDDLRTWANQKRFWVEVIGFVQSQLPAVFAQAHCSGLKNVSDNFESLNRGVKLIDGCAFFSPLLGRGFAVSSFAAGGHAPSRLLRLPAICTAALGKNYVEQLLSAEKDLLDYLSADLMLNQVPSL